MSERAFPHLDFGRLPIECRRREFLILAVATVLLPIAAKAQTEKFATDELVIVSHGQQNRFHVEIARTPGQMQQGLMYRRSLPPDAGMLFDYGRPTPAMMWMKNTLIPLDMLFVDAQGRIVNIQERAVPQSLDTIASAAPVRAVIELNGGTAARLGIKPGDRVMHPIFENG